ncbi:calcium-binding protein [Leptothoe sp. PORK10 BA2]|uniref:calcium-binding protein n=1 Tax=Leptothoe sp. PORK10 BA2 TaxID=3110254 RepID=UPI002B20DBE6|nr:calcium-binding protein [Leptothoe sp. PORK10 BA2]MEA5463737.1 calcium-binding protein [Leptothoe sp. PORK10 BA2]
MANVYGSNYNDNSTTNGFPFIYRPSLYGTNANDFMYGYAGNDRMYGFAGNDYLNGGTGADAMYGGTGNDTYIVDNVGDTVNESAGAGYDTVYSSISEILSANVERLILTGTGNNYGYGNSLGNSISGNSGNNYLWGAAGNDFMYGYAGNDTMNGGTGADAMYGGTGNDTYYVENVGDTVNESAGAGYDTVRSSISEILSTNVERLILTGTGNNYGYGNALNNSISGNSGNNYLWGAAGNDFMYGYAGNDIMNGGTGADSMHGGTGNDTYYVENVGDTVNESAGAGYDTVRASITEALSANVERLILTGAGNINGYGNSLSNSITGNAGDNYLSGYAGNDYILGAAGTDTLVGGSGNDRLNGYGGTTGEYDILSGDFSTSTPGVQGVSDGADTFILGDSSQAFYLGAGYATIKDFYHAEGDKFQVSGGIGDYSLNKTLNFGGTAANDTAIYYKSDLIGVVQDTTNVVLGADFQFV